MRRNGFTLVEAVIVVTIILMFAGILFPVIGRRHGHSDGRSRCQANLRQIGLGFKQYIQDFNEKFPPASRVQGSEWTEAIRPYLKSWQIFQCPTTKTSSPGNTDYFYNLRLAEITEKNIGCRSCTILSGDGNDNSLPGYLLSPLSSEWRKDATPARRHLDGANYAFVDGHVKWLSPLRILENAHSDAPTFAIK